MTIARRLSVGGSATFTPPAPGPIAPSGSRITIPSSGYNAFPGLDLDGTDRLLVYRSGSAHNSGGGDVDMRISSDGETWPSGGTTILAVASPDDLRDPGILVTSSGRWLVTFDHRNPFNSLNITAHWVYSDDQGSSWSATDDFTGLSGQLIASSQPIETADGILVPAYGTDGGEYIAGYWLSTDGGDTFGPYVDIAGTARDYQEPQVRQLDSGTYVALFRSESDQRTYRSESADLSSWSSPVDVNELTGRPDFVEYRPGRLIQFGRNATDSPGYYAVSFDEGDTWSTPGEIDAGEDDLWMYGAPVVTSTGTVEIVYCLESNSSTSGMFRRIFTDAP